MLAKGRDPVQLVGGIALLDVVVTNDRLLDLVEAYQPPELRWFVRLSLAHGLRMLLEETQHLPHHVTIAAENSRSCLGDHPFHQGSKVIDLDL